MVVLLEYCFSFSIAVHCLCIHRLSLLTDPKFFNLIKRYSQFLFSHRIKVSSMGFCYISVILILSSFDKYLIA